MYRIKLSFNLVAISKWIVCIETIKTPFENNLFTDCSQFEDYTSNKEINEISHRTIIDRAPSNIELVNKLLNRLLEIIIKKRIK